MDMLRKETDGAFNLLRGVSAVIAAVLFAHSSYSAEPEKCYLSRSYQAEVRDRATVIRDGGRVRFIFETTYCNYSMSPDCANGRSEDLEVQGVQRGDAVAAVSADGSCHVRIRFGRRGRMFVSQESPCPSILYWGPHGIYTEAPPQSCH